MKNTEFELRKLMKSYNDSYIKINKERDEAKECNDVEGIIIADALLQQCGIMINKLFNTMKLIGILDEEEIEFGSTKRLELLI